MLQGRSASKLCSSPVMNKETKSDASWLLHSCPRSCVMSSGAAGSWRKGCKGVLGPPVSTKMHTRLEARTIAHAWRSPLPAPAACRDRISTRSG